MTSDPSASSDRHYGTPSPGPADPLLGGPPEPAAGAPPEVIGPPPGSKPEPDLKFTRAAALWSSLFVGFLVLIVLLIFIAQNTSSTEFHFLGWAWSLPLGVAILAAAVCGGLLTVAAGTIRIFQLRRAAKRSMKAHR